MSRVAFPRQDAILQAYASGKGMPLLFQHGLGGSADQVAENVPDLAGVRRMTVECRGQGGSTPGSARPFRIATFADDALAFCDEQGAARFVVGGVSMGAAIALRLAVLHPGRVRALILARPAWLFDAAPANMKPFAEVAAALRTAPPAEARALFAASSTARVLGREAPDNLASLLGVFDRPNPDVTADLLGDIAADGPGVTEADARALRIPVLVIGHAVDIIHPLRHAKVLAATIPGARFVEIPAKALDKPAHVAAFRLAVTDFLDSLPFRTEFTP